MDPVTPPVEQSNHKVLAIAVIGFVLLAFVFLVMYLRSMGGAAAPQQNNTKTATSPTVALGKGKMHLKATQTSFKVGEPVIVTVYADSDNNSVAGFDAVIQFDPALVSYISAKSLVADFQAPIARKDERKVTVFSFKKLDSEKPVVLSDTPVVELTFKAMKAGSAPFTFEFTPPSTKDTNLMDEQKRPNDLLGSVEGTNVTITQ
jgi:hypothetical protein